MAADSVPIYLSIVVAFICAVGSIALAIFHIYRHLINYTEPIYQRFIVRIIFMVPEFYFNFYSVFSGSANFNILKIHKRLKWNLAVVFVSESSYGLCGVTIDIYRYAIAMYVVYALMSFLSLLLPNSSIYFNSIREIYEAWVIYNFLSLCLAWVGGPGAVVLSLSGRVLKPSWCLMTCCFPPMPLDGRFIRRCKQGCLQFVILKPILVVVTLVLYAQGKYHDGNFDPRQSYLCLTIIYTISYSMALYALALFYVACRDLLQPFNPVPKFIIIKSVVFLTYWQGVLVFLAAKSGFIKDAAEAARFQDFIICVEMLIAAVGHLYAFPYKEYAGANIGQSKGFMGSLYHALKLNDFYHDTVHQFAPTYHEYVLYNHSEGDEGTKKYRSRTFVPTGQEMDTVRRNKIIIGNKMEELQLSDSSGSSSPTNHSEAPGAHSTNPEAVNDKLSFLVDTSDSISTSYDMSLIDLDMPDYPTEVPAATNIENR